MPTMTPGIRKLALTAHVTSSVGWLGAVAAFLALAIAGLASQDAQLVLASYLAMELTGWLVIVPLSVASLLSGLVQSLGTTWGLFRHYWVVAKLLITVLATIVLLVHMQPIGHIADAVRAATLARGELGGLRVQLVADAGAALVVLLIATTLSVFKPRGLTAYGQRVQHDASGSALGGLNSGGRGANAGTPRWVTVSQVIVALLVLLFLFRHLMGGGLGNHGP